MAELTQTKLPRPRAAVLRTKEYHPPLDGRDGLRLDFNENTFACSPRVLDALRNVTAADLTRYPEREPLERRVAERLGLNPEQVLLTNGVDEAMHVLCQTWLDADDEILFSVPTYSMYEVYASATDARVVTVQAAADFAFPFERLIEAITPATRLIVLANPNSPTGSVATRGQILRLAEIAPQAVVVADEAYYHFFGETVIDQVGRVPNLIVARTFSKAYGLAGVRLGMLAASAESMRWMRRMISPYSVNSVALVCLAAVLEDEDYLQWYVAEVKAARAEFIAAVEKLGVPHWPSEANFVLVKVGQRHREFVEAMHARGVLVRDRSNDPGCDGCVRVTIGTREHTARGIAAMEEALRQIEWNGESR